MKKIIISLVLIMSVLVSLCACGSTEMDYDAINALANQSYTSITLDITTVTGDVELKANYVMSAGQVIYSVDALNLISEEYKEGEGYKTTYTGTATTHDGKVDTVDGEYAIIPSYDELSGSFSFKESNFANVVSKKGSFSADVVSAKELVGSEADMSNMKITLEYTETALVKMTLTYSLSGSSVVTVYTYTK